MLRVCILALLLTLTGCESKPVAEVGEYKITRDDVELRDKVVRYYYTDEKREGVGIIQLIDAFTNAEILRRYGHPITEKVIDGEVKRIDDTTAAPAALAQIKAIFHRDPGAYRRLYVVPVYAGRVIYFGLFLNHPEIQRKSREAAEAVIARATKEGITFEKIGRSSDLTWERLELSDRGMAPPGKLPPEATLPKEAPQELAQKMREVHQKQLSGDAAKVKEALNGLRPGQVSPRVIDIGERWRIVRMLEKRKNAVLFESITIPKEDYGKWLEAEKAKVPIVLHEKSYCGVLGDLGARLGC